MGKSELALLEMLSKGRREGRDHCQIPDDNHFSSQIPDARLDSQPSTATAVSTEE